MSLAEAQERHKSMGRNDACSCGSGKKYKKCHQPEDDQLINAELRRLVEEAKAAAAAEAEAEAAKKADEPKDKAPSKTKPKGTSARGASSKAVTGARGAQGAKAQSLPRRGAV
jgi:hypothetical protein